MGTTGTMGGWPLGATVSAAGASLFTMGMIDAGLILSDSNDSADSADSSPGPSSTGINAGTTGTTGTTGTVPF